MELEKIQAVHGRAEDAAHDNVSRETFDFCVSRAVANLSTLSEYCLPFVKVGGWFVPYKSGKLEEEMKTGKGAIRKLGGELEDVISFHLANEDERNLVRIHKTERTGKKYPRKAGTPSREAAEIKQSKVDRERLYMEHVVCSLLFHIGGV